MNLIIMSSRALSKTHLLNYRRTENVKFYTHIIGRTNRWRRAFDKRGLVGGVVMSGKKETLEQASYGVIGGIGIAAPHLLNLADQVQALSMIFSFFFIIIPTGIWATLRAYRAIKKSFKEAKNEF